MLQRAKLWSGVSTVLAAAATSLAACGGTPCEDAVDKLADCEERVSPFDAEFTASSEECTGVDECRANCLLNASCADIQTFVTAPTAETQYSLCEKACLAGVAAK